MNDGCEDEGLCGGFVYGMFCKDSQGKRNYVMPREICDGLPLNYPRVCANNEDEADCPDLKTVPDNEKCTTRVLKGTVWIPLLNRTRCTGGWRDDIPPYEGFLGELCINYLDQTNCTDPNRFLPIF
jgi:hypothetical protein